MVDDQTPQQPNGSADQGHAASPQGGAHTQGNVPATQGNLPAVVDEHAAKAKQRGWFYIPLDGHAVPADVLALMESSVARRHNVLPVGVKDRQVWVACENPDDFNLRNTLSPMFAPRTMRLMYADPAAIRRKIEEVYSAANEAESLARQRRAASAGGSSQGGDLGRVVSGEDGENAKLLKLIIEQAQRDGASDIHFEPTETRLEIRFRIDNKLRIAMTYPLSKAIELVTLIKVDAGMKSDNFLVPDSGVYIFRQPGRKPFDIRVETAPTAWGTSCVMRLQVNIWRPLSSLGFSDYNLHRYMSAIGQPEGVVLATGPTGSGKSTTLYASLNERISPDIKIITLENPIEYKAPSGISQIQINEQQGMTFPEGLRSILRQDPNIILVGEVRDRETAETAVDAAMTGHLVFSTLHTNDAPGAIQRLARMGIEPFLLSDSLLGVVGQRLVRRLCPTCKITVAPDRDQIAAWGFDPSQVPSEVFAPHPEGCNDCLGRGFAGRVPIHEVMLVSEDLKDAIADDRPQSVLSRLAREAGMKTMREDGFEKAVIEGLTSIAEVNTSTRRALA